MSEGQDSNFDNKEFENFFPDFKRLYKNKDILLSSSTNYATKEDFLVKALSFYVGNKEDQQKQSEILRLALGHGVDISKIEGFHPNFELLYSNKDVFLDLPANSVTKEFFFAKTISLYIFHEDGIRKQSEILRLALNDGIDITKLKGFHPSFELLYSNKDVFLDLPANSGTKEFFFAKALSSYVDNKEDQQKQSEILRLALGHGVDISKIEGFHPSFELLYSNKDVFLDLPANSVTKEDFLVKALSFYVGNEEDQQKQSDILRLALGHGVDISKIEGFHPSFELLYSNKDVFLDLPANSVTKEFFFARALSFYVSSKENQQKQSEILRSALDHGVDVSKIESFYPNFEFLYNNKDIFFNSSVNSASREFFLKKSLSVYDWSPRYSDLVDFLIEQKFNFSEINSLPMNMPAEDLEKMLANGLSINRATEIVIHTFTSGDDGIHGQEKLIAYLAEKGANFSGLYYVPEYFSKKTYEIMLESSLNPQLVLKTAFRLEPREERDQLFDLALAYRIDFSSRLVSLNDLSFRELEKCLAKGLLTLEGLVGNIFDGVRRGYDPENTEYSSASLTEKQIELLNFAKEKQVDFSKVFSELFNTYSTTSNSNGVIVPYVIPEKILKILIKDYSLDPNSVLLYGIGQRVVDIVKLALTYNADVNSSIANDALFSQSTEIIDLLLEKGAKLELSAEDYVYFLKVTDFNFVVQILPKLPKVYSDTQIYDVLRSYGGSEAECRNLLDIHSLIKDCISAMKGNESSLSEAELSILSGKALISSVSEFNPENFTNKYGFGALHLAIIVKDYNLAKYLIQNGHNIYSKTHSNITALQILADGGGSANIAELGDIILDFINDVDIKLGSSESLADILIRNKELELKVIEKTKDPLFSLFKQNYDLFAPSNDLNKTYIAISHGDNFWSTGMWSTARIISKNYPNVVVHLINDDMIKNGGEAFIRQFDAVINPGAGDTYPRLEEFTKADCSFQMNLEKHYQNMLELSDKYNIPYLGMCAGAQHFAMYHGGSLRPIHGYNMGQHQINYIEGSLPYFMVLTKDQQKDVLQNCEFPKISFKGDTAHHYAAVNHKLGEGMHLGAISEDNVAMSYAHANGIRYATQFHPEHFYGNKDNEDSVNQKAWINNFVEVAIMHHEHRVNDDDHPIKYFADIKTRLDECISVPTCLAEDSLANYQSLYTA